MSGILMCTKAVHPELITGHYTCFQLDIWRLWKGLLIAQTALWYKILNLLSCPFSFCPSTNSLNSLLKDPFVMYHISLFLSLRLLYKRSTRETFLHGSREGGSSSDFLETLKEALWGNDLLVMIICKQQWISSYRINQIFFVDGFTKEREKVEFFKIMLQKFIDDCSLITFCQL